MVVRTHMWSLRAVLLLGMMTCFALGVAETESCDDGSCNGGVGASLLQTRKKHFEEQSVGLTEGRLLHFGQAHSGQTQLNLAPAAGTAKAALPAHLFTFGVQLFQSEALLDVIVANTVVQHQFYAGKQMTVRMVTGDGVDGEDFYGVPTLHTNPAYIASGSGMMNMLDIGGNYGRVSISAYLNYPLRLRCVAVEPIPSTYFLLRWNLWLNAVPELTLEEFQANVTRPGVVALNNLIENVDGKTTGLCYTPPLTMGARICNCSQGWLHKPGEHCEYVTSRTMNNIVSRFGGHPITFLKMDCEGCELDVIPALTNLLASGALQVHRFAGELHAMPNELEDVACKYEGGQWFVHVCFQKGVGTTFSGATQRARCLNPARESCSRLPYSVLRDQRPPPTEW